MALFYYYFYAHTSPIPPAPSFPPRIDSAPAEWEQHHLTELCYHRAAKNQRQRLLPPPAPLPGGDTAQPIGPAQLVWAKPHPRHFPGTRGGRWHPALGSWLQRILAFSPFFPRPEASRSRGEPRRCPGMPAQVRGGGWKALALQRERGMRRAGFTCSRRGGRRRARKTASLWLGKRGICLPADRRGGGEGTAARGERLSQVSEAAGREGAMGERPERGGSPAELGTRCDTAGDRAGRATRCGGDSGHRGHAATSPRGNKGKSASPTCLPPFHPSPLPHSPSAWLSRSKPVHSGAS